MRLALGGMLAKAPRSPIWRRMALLSLGSSPRTGSALVGVDEAGHGQLFEQDLACRAVGNVAAGEHEGDGPPQAIGQGMDLGGAATTRTAYSLAVLPPLPPAAQRCARTAEESIRICAGGPPALASAWKMSLHTPLAAQRWKRL